MIDRQLQCKNICLSPHRNTGQGAECGSLGSFHVQAQAKRDLEVGTSWTSLRQGLKAQAGAYMNSWAHKKERGCSQKDKQDPQSLLVFPET